MTLTGIMELEVAVPEKASITFAEDGHITVKGPKGEVTRHFIQGKIKIRQDGDRVLLTAEYPRKKDKALLGTYRGHIANMLKGVTEGFTYEMKVVYSHFPMKVSVKGDKLVVDNFLGEEHPRIANIVGETKVVVKGETVTLEGVNKEHVGQSAANIEKATKITKVDPRVFQDGIYIVRKG